MQKRRFPARAGYPRAAAAAPAAVQAYYRGNFPAALAAGELTGEASPGYMVYSEVRHGP